MRALLEVVLDSIKNHTAGLTYELILIDNDSQDGTSEMIKEKYPEATLIVNSRNMGVAPARNQGLKIAEGKYIKGENGQKYELGYWSNHKTRNRYDENVRSFQGAKKDCWTYR